MHSDPTIFIEHIQGIVCCPALNKQSCEHILEFMAEQVPQMYLESMFSVMIIRNQQTFVFTFNTPVLPLVVKLYFI